MIRKIKMDILIIPVSTIIWLEEKSKRVLPCCGKKLFIEGATDMSDKKIRTMVMAAVLAALACVATMVIQIPSPMNGFVNLGDCFVLLSGWLLGPWWGAAAGGIGSMLADLLLGYGHYAPGTLVIKGLMALVGALVFKAMGKKSAAALVSGVVSEVIMVVGYFGYAGLLLGKGIGAAASIPGNLVQGAVGLVAGFLLLQVARRIHLEEKVNV